MIDGDSKIRKEKLRRGQYSNKYFRKEERKNKKRLFIKNFGRSDIIKCLQDCKGKFFWHKNPLNRFCCFYIRGKRTRNNYTYEHERGLRIYLLR